MKDFLHTLINQAGKLSLEYKSRLSTIKIDHKSPKDLVTEADVAIERFIVEQINAKFPSHSILGEESGTHTGNEYQWIIDPIDGTTSFVHDQPFYSISIAVYKNNAPIMGGVYAPVLQELFFAETGCGATCNDKPIKVSTCEHISDAVLGTGFSCIRANQPQNNIPYFTHILPQIRGVRRFGSVAIDLSYIAHGRLDGFWELNLNLYDIAAGMLIANEAGAITTDFFGNPHNIPSQLICANKNIHPQLLNLIQQVHETLS